MPLLFVVVFRIIFHGFALFRKVARYPGLHF